MGCGMLTFSKIGRYGRIGNQMSQIAGTIGIAERMGYDYGFPYWMNYDHLERFGFSEDIDIQKWFANPLPLSEGDFTPYHVKWGYHEVSPPDGSDIHGHMQSERYFLHCEDKIRHYFEFKNKTENKQAISVHYRGGDYGGDYHPRCSPEYYREAFKLLPDLEVFIFSDSPDEAKQVIGRGTVIEGNHSMVDMELMSRCSHHIIANSTFSWWGAWLSGGQVIAPRRWFGPAAKLITTDIYCKNWIII